MGSEAQTVPSLMGRFPPLRHAGTGTVFLGVTGRPTSALAPHGTCLRGADQGGRLCPGDLLTAAAGAGPRQ